MIERQTPRFSESVPAPNKHVAVKKELPINENIPYGYPSEDCQILIRVGYIACYDTKTKVADWVSYHLTGNDLNGPARRTDDFKADKDIAPGQRSELMDFKQSGFDKGHLAPAGDMTRSYDTMSESFLLTNIAPQTPRLNRGYWKALEDKVRKWAAEKTNIYVVTGPLYLYPDQDNNGRADVPTIGQSEVSIPSHFFKIIISGSPESKDLDAIAFVMPNWDSPFGLFDNYISSIDDIEDLTGFNFLQSLDDAVENNLEASKKRSSDAFSGGQLEQRIKAIGLLGENEPDYQDDENVKRIGNLEIRN